MKKKFWLIMLTLLTVLCLALGLAACGGTTNPSEQGGETDPPTHAHRYNVENVCEECGEKLKFTDGLTYELDTGTDTFTVTGIGTAADGVESFALVIPYGYQGKPVTAIGEAAFSSAFPRCFAITSVSIPDSVTEIGASAFENCIKVTDVWIGNSVTTIGARAFALCYELLSIEIPDSVTTIGDKAFSWCSVMASATIGNGVTSIGEYAFDICPGLTRLSLGSSVAEIGEGAFKSSIKLFEVWNYSELQLEPGSEEYGSVALYAKHIYTGEEPGNRTVTEDGYIFYEEGEESYLLGYCGRETELTLPEKTPSGKTYTIYQAAFFQNLELISLTISGGVTAIGDDAFFGSTGLASLSIGNSVTSIGKSAFYNCYNLTRVVIGSSVTEIGDWAFGSCYELIEIWNHSELVFQPESEDYGAIAYYAKHVYTGAEKGYQTVTQDGFIFYEEGEESYLIAYRGNKAKLTLPEKSPSGKTYTIYQYAFSYNSPVKSIVIGNGVTSIDEYAFFGSILLREVTIPSSVTAIGSGAFSYCETNAYYEGTPAEWILIEGYDDASLDDSILYFYSSETPSEEQWQESEYWWHYDSETNAPTPWMKDEAPMSAM